MINLNKTNDLVKLSTELHNTNYKLYQAKINSEIFVDKQMYLDQIESLELQMVKLTGEINSLLGELYE